MRAQITSRFGNLPIRRKLRVMFLATTVTALALAGMGIVAADSLLFYNYLRRDLTTFVQILGDNSTGALAFDDARAAAETLAALRARSHIQNACLYQNSGALLASYSRPGYNGSCIAEKAEALRLEQRVLVAVHQVRLKERPLGVLVVRYDLEEIVDRSILYSGMVLAALLLSWLITIPLSSRLRSLISDPILKLAGTARSVSQQKDYSIRATKQSEDEVGVLADALNQMMEGIQSRDNDLQAALADQRDALRKLEKLNVDLQHSNAELGRSNNDLARFAFIASHDLQEPLRMITAYTQLLVAQYGAQDGERSSEIVRYIVGGTKRMRELLDDLSIYTEIAGFVEQSPEVVDLNAVLEKVKQVLSIRITETQAQIVAADLPSLVTHQSRMASLFQNLIENAIKYRSDAPPQIQISLRDDGKEFVFAVSDNGIGIEKEYHEKIFVAFQRLHGKDVPGSGIGLAICQRVVEGYGGRIWVESGGKAGSTFVFTLPKSMAQSVTT